jgi:hypothetical protein
MASTYSSDRWQCWPGVFKAEFAKTLAGLQLDLGTLATADRTSNAVCCALLIRRKRTSNALPRPHEAQNETNNLSLFLKALHNTCVWHRLSMAACLVQPFDQ